jgi:hypothetical protein
MQDEDRTWSDDMYDLAMGFILGLEVAISVGSLAVIGLAVVWMVLGRFL